MILNENKLISLISEPFINKAEIAASIYESEIAAQKLTRESARKRLQTKLSRQVQFTKEELESLEHLCMGFQEKLNDVKYQASSFKDGHYATDGKKEFRIVHLDISFSDLVKVVDLEGNLLEVPFGSVKPIILNDDWVKKLGLKKDSKLMTDRLKDWYLRKTSYTYYIIGELKSGGENPVLSLSYVHELQFWFKGLTGQELFIKN